MPVSGTGAFYRGFRRGWVTATPQEGLIHAGPAQPRPTLLSLGTLTLVAACASRPGHPCHVWCPLGASHLSPSLSPHDRLPRDGSAVLATGGVPGVFVTAASWDFIFVDTNIGEYFHLVRVSLFKRATLGGPTQVSGDVSVP